MFFDGNFPVWEAHSIVSFIQLPMRSAKVHKNGQLELECVTPIEVHSPVKIIELY